MPGPPLISVVVATRDRPQKLNHLLEALEAQTLDRGRFEIIVVDDGSKPPVSLRDGRLVLLREAGVERCRARNAGAAAASGELLLFLDDDMVPAPGCLAAHCEAHRNWPQCVVIGAVHLPPALAETPFGRFRGAQDQGDWPAQGGPGTNADFCTAQNMSLARERFLMIGGFDPQLTVSEDQDLGLRWLADGGKIAFLPTATALHDDGARDIRAYCRRMEWGQMHQVAFARKYPRLASSRKRAAVNGPLRPGREPLPRSALKLLKALLGFAPVLSALFGCASRLERSAPQSKTLKRLYKLLLAIHLQRGWRKGLREYGE